MLILIFSLYGLAALVILMKRRQLAVYLLIVNLGLSLLTFIHHITTTIGLSL